jgi:NAD(P)-dependent dehydrogenase (short-subunit alcohol dehydrogenase family)
VAGHDATALELARPGVHVNAIAPGPVRTHIGGGVLPTPEIERMWADTVPLGRTPEAQDVSAGHVVRTVKPRREPA